MLRSTAPWRLIDHRGATRFAILSTLCLGIGLASAPAQAGPKVGLFHGATSGPAAEIKQKLDATMAFDKVDLIDGTRIDPNILTTLKQYQALVLFNNNGNAWADLANSGNAVAQFIDDGGGVVVYNPYITYNSPSYGPQGNFVSKYLLSDPATASSFFGLTLGNVVMPAHPVMAGVTMMPTTTGQRCIYLRLSNFRNGGTTVASWSDGVPMVVVGTINGHNRVDLNMTAGSGPTGGCFDANSDGYKLLINALNWVANPVQATPSSVDFGNVGQNVTSAPKQVEVKNTGMTGVTLTKGTVSGNEFTVRLLNGANYPVNLGAGQSMFFEVTVRPAATGRRTGSYTIDTTGASGSMSVAFAATGIGPVFAATPSPIDFGGVRLGSPPGPINVLLRNDGGGQLRLRSLAVTDTTNFKLENLPSLPNDLNGGAAQTVDVRFTPTMMGRFNAKLQVTYDGASMGMVSEVPITGSAGEPAITVASAVTLQVGRVATCGPNETIPVSNSGFAKLTISKLESSSMEFKVVSTTPLIVGPNNGAEDIVVQFCPSTMGRRTANLTITSDAPGSPHVVRLEGVGTTATLDVSVTSLDFPGDTQLGSCTAAKPFTISNRGNGRLSITSARFDGAAKDSYRLEQTVSVVQPMSQATMSVKFCPVGTGTQAAKLVLVSDAPSTVEIALTGKGTGARAEISEPKLDFGEVFLKTLSMEKTVMLKNVGDVPLVFGASTWTPMNSVFTVGGLPNNMDTLMPGAAVALKVRAQPTSPAPFSAKLELASNDAVAPGGKLTFEFTVTGVQATIRVDPKMLNFGTAAVGVRAGQQSFTIENTGKLALTGLTGQLITGNGDYLVSGIADMLAPGQKISVSVDFKPEGPDQRDGILRITAVGVDAPEEVRLTGVGVLPSVKCRQDKLDFKSVLIGESGTVALQCYNEDPKDTELALGLPEGSDFSIEGGPMVTVPSGSPDTPSEVKIQVVFKPTKSGTINDRLEIRTKEGNAVIASVDLQGIGLPVRVKESGCSIGGGHDAPAPLGLLLSLGLLGLAARRRRARA